MTSFETVDGYAYSDLREATSLVGPVRSAKKVLPRTTIDLARHATYVCAVHQLSGIAGGALALNADRAADGEPSFSSFAEEAQTWTAATGFRGSTPLGLSEVEAGPLLQTTYQIQSDALIASAVHSAPVASATVIVVSDDDEEKLLAAIGELNPSSLQTLKHGDDALSSEADTMFIRGKTGVINHVAAESLNVSHAVGLQPLTFTARGLAVASQGDTVVIPDFISSAGPILASAQPNLDIAAATQSVLESLHGEGTNMFVAACEAAESFLRTWSTTLPFGRPLAP